MMVMAVQIAGDVGHPIAGPNAAHVARPLEEIEGAEDGSPPDPYAVALQIVQQLFGGEALGAGHDELNQGTPLARDRIALRGEPAKNRWNQGG